ncbi:MAG: DUF1850 domain-containing protein [Thermoanaerobacteraceae bacterium]|nr:DUF1850 domain-containing protein [Thermoanaerobacteraceae bacterium]
MIYTIVLSIFLLAGFFLAGTDVLSVYDVTSNRLLLDIPLLDDRFSLWYIHSIQLTPSFENFIVKGKKMILYETVYETVGVGLPSVDEGSFYMRDGKMVMTLHREFEEILLRIYPKPDNSIIVRGKKYRLMDYAESEDLIRLSIHRGYNPLYFIGRK